jgi:hypothetical protein
MRAEMVVLTLLALVAFAANSPLTRLALVLAAKARPT